MNNYLLILQDRLTKANVQIKVQALNETDATHVADRLAYKLDLRVEDVVLDNIPKGKK